MTWTALDTTSAGRFWPLGPVGIGSVQRVQLDLHVIAGSDERRKLIDQIAYTFCAKPVTGRVKGQVSLNVEKKRRIDVRRLDVGNVIWTHLAAPAFR
jgi:hypothetical protein